MFDLSVELLHSLVEPMRRHTYEGRSMHDATIASSVLILVLQYTFTVVKYGVEDNSPLDKLSQQDMDRQSTTRQARPRGGETAGKHLKIYVFTDACYESTHMQLPYLAICILYKCCFTWCRF